MAKKLDTHHKTLDKRITNVSHALTFDTGPIFGAAPSPGVETCLLGTTALMTYGTSVLSGALGGFNPTLADGTYQGQIKFITMVNHDNACDVSITNHVTSSPEIARFNTINQIIVLVWTGTKWETVKATCAFP